MQVPLTSHGEQLLRHALARRPGQSPTQIVEEALERQQWESPGPPTLPPVNRLSPEQWETALDRMAQFSDKIPLLPEEAFSRESLHEDHD